MYFYLVYKKLSELSTVIQYRKKLTSMLWDKQNSSYLFKMNEPLLNFDLIVLIEITLDLHLSRNNA